MSIPANPLSKYRSYAYHHILIACDSTATAEALIKSPSGDNYGAMVVNDYTPHPIELGDSKGSKETGQYVVVINGTTNSEFVITNAEWETQMVPVGTTAEHFTSLAVQGELLIAEPRGVRFTNVLTDVCTNLYTDPTGLVWVLKTIFVGHAYDPTRGQYTDAITNITPFMFMMIDLTADFDERGGLYKIGVVGITNGVAKLPQIVAAGENIKLQASCGESGKEPTLQVVMRELTKWINTRYDKFYEKVQEQLSQQAERMQLELKETTETIKHLRSGTFFRKVKYRIELGADGDEKGYNSEKYTVKASQYMQGDGTGSVLFSFGENPNIESIIGIIMNASPQVGEDAKDKDETGNPKNRWIYKIHTTVDSRAEEYVVVYNIKKTFVPSRDRSSNNAAARGLYERVLDAKKINNIDVTHKTKEHIKELEQQWHDELAKQNQLIIFDYIYSGKNIDIKTFNMRMEMGLAFLMTMAPTENIVEVQHMVEGTEAEVIVKDIPVSSNKKEFVPRYKTPLFPPRTMKIASRRGTGTPSSQLDFQTALSKHAAVESMDVTITILGNSNLLNHTTILPSDVATLNSTNSEKFPFQPALAKINIFMPSNGATQDFATRFWYDGLYSLQVIKHKFEMGEFTQELSLVALPRETLYDSKMREQQKENSAKQMACRKKVSENLYDKKLNEPPAGLGRYVGEKYVVGSSPTGEWSKFKSGQEVRWDGVEWVLVVKPDANRVNEPPNKARYTGETYIVGSNPTGVWEEVGMKPGFVVRWAGVETRGRRGWQVIQTERTKQGTSECEKKEKDETTTAKENIQSQYDECLIKEFKLKRITPLVGETSNEQDTDNDEFPN